MSSTAARTTRARRTAVIAVTMMTVGAAAVIAPTSAIVAANAAGVAPAAVSASSLAGAVTAAGASAVVATSGTTTPAPRATTASRSTTRTAIAPYRVGTKAYSKWFARDVHGEAFGWKSQRQYQCLVNLWKRESGWRHKAAQLEQRRPRDPAGTAREQDGLGRTQLALQPPHADQVGSQVHQRSLRKPLRRLVALAEPALVLIRC